MTALVDTRPPPAATGRAPFPARALAAGERRVLRARVRPATPEGAWALRLAVEDALRCASFDDHGRLVIVRRLRITALPAGVRGVELTRALERAWRDAARLAVPALSGGDAGAATEASDSAAVWFASVADAAMAALVRVLEGRPLQAWFWPAAVPVLQGTQGVAQQVARLVAALQTQAVHAWPQALARWPPRRRMLLSGWMPEVAAVALAGATRDEADDGAAPGARSLPESGSGSSSGSAWADGTGAVRGALPTRTQQASGGDAPAAVGYSPVWAAGAAPPNALDANADAQTIPGEAHAVGERTRHSPTANALPAAVTEVDRVAVHGPAAMEISTGAIRADTEPPSLENALAPPHRAEQGPQKLARAQPARATHPSLSWSSSPWLRDAVFSQHAGALWLVNLLDNLGFGADAEQPHLLAQVLGGLFRVAGLPLADPHWALLLRHNGTADDIDLLAAVQNTAPSRTAREWKFRARRALRRQTGMSVAELARRPGWVTLTLTHADIVLPMDAIDLRARRRGLDRDPGYVPWLGRIVAFHFVARADCPMPELRDG